MRKWIRCSTRWTGCWRVASAETLAPPSARELFARMRDKRILVVGDAMIDEWIWGDVSRISPEAPVPVVAVREHTFTLGGAGNVANNLRALGARVSFVGVVGDLDPSKPDFAEYLNRFSKDPLWRGIRYARVWQMEGGKQVLKPGMAEGLKLLAQMGQTLDMANPSFDLLRGALLAMEAVPDLRVVMDHMPSLDPMPQTQALYDSLIRDLAQHPNFFLKLSQVIHKDENGVTVTAPRARLDQLMAAFGEDRVMFGGDWPNSVGTATIPEALALIRDYFAARPRIQAEKYFWKNSQHIYRWKNRDAAQPS